MPKAKLLGVMAPVISVLAMAYERCVALAKEHKVPQTDPFAKSCTDWLAANE